MNVLAVNPGSSTLKYKLFHCVSEDEDPVSRRRSVQRIGAAGSISLARSGQNRGSTAAGSMREAADAVFKALAGQTIDTIGYRVVHGGHRFTAPTRLTPDVRREIARLSDLALLHNRTALECIEAGLRWRQGAQGVAVFDTAFHHSMPESAHGYGIPHALADRHHLRRYGFHGISHRFVSETLLLFLKRPASGSRLITCHLGNGASLCAVRDGKSADTTMGLTPMEGLMMGTRCGDIDPGLVLHLVRTLKMSAGEVDTMLNRQSGLLGVSGLSADVRELSHAAEGGNARAEVALEMFAYRCRKYIGAYAAALGGVDGIAFTGGIGEHAPAVRARIAKGLEFLGIVLDPDRNAAAVGGSPSRISKGTVEVWVIPSDEERQLAGEVFELLTTADGEKNE